MKVIKITMDASRSSTPDGLELVLNPYSSPAPSVSVFEQVFNSSDAVTLELADLIPPPVSGIRKIKKCYLHILRKDHLVPEDLVSRGNERTSAVETRIPEVLLSEQTYQYCGFTPAVAAELWSDFQANRQFSGPNHRDYFLSFVFAQIDAVPEPTSEDETEWTTTLQDIGLDSRTQDVIMDPEFADLRGTASAAFWAKDTVDNRLYTIEDFRRASWQRVQHGNSGEQQVEREE